MRNRFLKMKISYILDTRGKSDTVDEFYSIEYYPHSHNVFAMDK